MIRLSDTNLSATRRLASLGAVALVLVAIPLAAQRSGPMYDARTGDGELERAGDTFKIAECTVALRADGTVWIEARGRGSRYEFSGSWRQGDREQRLWTIDRAFGENANAEGWVMTRDGRMKQVEIVGRYGGGRKVRLSFMATGDLPPRPPVGRGIDSRRDGEGSLERGRGRQPLRAARVVLEPSGRAEVVLYGFAELRLEGIWREDGRDRVRFTTDRGFGGETGGGDGAIELAGGALARLSLRGTSGPGRYDADFRAGVATPLPGDRPGRESLSERAGYNMEGGDYTHVYFETLRECQAACRREDRCLAYTYNTRSRMCYLKDRVGGYQRRDDTVSGEKGGGR